MARLFVVIPARNVAEFIEDALDSVLKQPEVDCVYVVDDASDDDLKEKVLERHPLAVRYYRLNQHHNQYFAKNVALREIFGDLNVAERPDYIAFMDGDDVSYRDRFARQLEVMENDALVWAVGGACNNITWDEKNPVFSREVAWPLEKDPLLKGVRQYGIGLWNATAMYRREVFEWLGSFDYASGMGDTEWFIRLVWASVLANRKLVNLQGPVIHRRIRASQVSNEASKIGSAWRTAYEPLLKQQFIFLKTLHGLNLLDRMHVYRGNPVSLEDYGLYG